MPGEGGRSAPFASTPRHVTQGKPWYRMLMSNPLPVPTTSSRLLAMAVVLVGSKQTLQQHLKLSMDELLSLLAGKRELTRIELDLLTTLLVTEQAHMLQQNRDLRELVTLLRTPRR